MSADRDPLQDLHALAAQTTGKTVTGSEPVPGGGSRRGFFRLTLAGGGTVMGVLGHDLDEVRTFLRFTAHLAQRGLPVPRVLAEDAPRGLYVMEDLGHETLADRIAAWRESPDGPARIAAALETVVRWLAAIQVRGGQGLDGLLPPGAEELDGAVFRGDLERFQQHFLPRFAPRPAPVTGAVAADLEALVARLEALPREHFCYRDFQTRNIMWAEREGTGISGVILGPVFLDYQSGRRGALAYDLTSLLHSPSSGANETMREKLIGAYLEALAGQGVALQRESFLREFYPMVLVRRLQALGAYADLGVTCRRPDFLERIPPAVAGLAELLRAGRFDFGLPALEAWLGQVLGL